MTSRPRITARITSLAHSFVHAVIPRHVDLKQQAELYKVSGFNAGECVYCGASTVGEDHLRGLVKGSRPSGYFHFADNIVPACVKCNSSKGGSDWRAWMLGNAKGSPTTRQIADRAIRFAKLARFEAQSCTKRVSEDELRAAVGGETWDAYWDRLKRIESDLRAADREADVLRDRLASAFSHSRETS